METPLTDLVARQYERWMYPEPLQDLSGIKFESTANHYKDLYWAFWPRAPYRTDLDVLIAGCGTIAAACYAYLYPQARVVGIDVSAASLAHEEYLKQKHGLHNLTLHQLPLEDVASLHADYDLIVAHGVLHHLANPVAGLRALAGVLRPEGVVDIFVYARYGRVGVYMLQEFFRLMNVQQDEEGLQLVKRALAALGPGHPLQPKQRASRELQTDAGLVDALLHRRDRPYTVAECLGLVAEAGLAFQGWHENGHYYPDSQISAHDPLYARLGKLDEPTLWQAMELFDGRQTVHLFYACRRDRPEANYRLDFRGDGFLDYIPVPRVTRVQPPDRRTGQATLIARPPFRPIALNDWQERVFGQIDGTRTIRACLDNAQLAAPPASVLSFARTFFQTLWRFGYMVFRLP